MIDGCADPRRDRAGGSTTDVRAAYLELHRLGWAHTVEAWSQDGASSGGSTAWRSGGCSPASRCSHPRRARDASKVALVGLVDAAARGGRNRAGGWSTSSGAPPHLATLGVRAVRRRAYLRSLHRALALALPAAFDDGR